MPAPAATPPPLLATVRSAIGWCIGLLVAAYVIGGLPMPYALASMVPAVGAAVAGGRALRKIGRDRARAGLRVIVTAALVASVWLTVIATAGLVLRSELVERQECLARAITQSSMRACEATFTEQYEARFGSQEKAE